MKLTLTLALALLLSITLSGCILIQDNYTPLYQVKPEKQDIEKKQKWN